MFLEQPLQTLKENPAEIRRIKTESPLSHSGTLQMKESVY